MFEQRNPLIAIIGDGQVEEGSKLWNLAYDTSRLLVNEEYLLLTGGLGGVMEGASRGARASALYRGKSVLGILPGDSPRDANASVDIAIPTGLGHLRNSIVAHSDVVIAIGGGAGTLSEMALAWIYKRMIVAFRVKGWSGRLADKRIDHRRRFEDVEDDRVYGIDAPDEVIPLLKKKLQLYTRG